MKKFISILLSVLMIFSTVSVAASAAEKEELKITVANDLHYNYAYGNYSGTDYAEDDYSHVPGNGQLWIESIFIIREFFKEFKESDSKILLIPGDLVDHGTQVEHAAFSLELAALEKTGKRVYVVPGNHDYYGKDKTTPAQFAEYYAAFGYSEAIARDPASASYVAELNDEYRLLAIDSCLPGEGSSGIDEKRKAWIEQQAQQAQKDGKKLISMMHHNMLDHFVFGEIIHPGAFVSSEIGLPELYAQYNVKYNFTGHTHSHDVKAYTGANGVTIYDVLTSSINLYPLPYRTVTFGEEVKIRTEFIEKIDMTGASYGMPSKEGVISPACYKLASEDLQAYALECANRGLNSVFDDYLSTSKIQSLLKVDVESNPEVCDVIDKVLPRFRELINMPMYSKDAKGGESLEKHAKKLGLDFPETDISSFRELAVFLYQQYVEGDENFGFFSAEYVLLTASLTAILNQLLSDVTAEDYATLLNYLVRFFKLEDKVSALTSYAGDAVSRIKGIDIFVSALGSSVLLFFTTDELPADNNPTLPGYEAPVQDEATLSFWDKIVNFFTTFFDYILRIFGVGQ